MKRYTLKEIRERHPDLKDARLFPIDRRKPPAPREESEAVLCPHCKKPLCCGECGKPITLTRPQWRERIRQGIAEWRKANPNAPRDKYREIGRMLLEADGIRADHKTIASIAREGFGEIPQPGPIRAKQIAERNKELVLSAHIGTNGGLMVGVAALYFRPGDRIADVTFGKGRLWSKLDLRRFTFFASDIDPQHEYGKHHGVTIAKHDCRKLPYDSGSLDVVVIDYPYSRHTHFEDAFRTQSLVERGGHWMPDGMEALAEAVRVAKPGALILYKCQDGISGGRQRRYAYEIWEYATKELGLIDQDQFFLILERQYAMKGAGGKVREVQIHALKNQSVLWVFRKPLKPK